MEAIAKTKYLKGSPRKARLVIDLIRGQKVDRALAILKFTQKRAAQPIAKCLNSAIANATYKAEQNNIAVDPDDLWVKACYVDMGPTKNRRRMRPAPQGRAYREQRHYCHITIEVSSEERPLSEKELKAKEAKEIRAAQAKAKTKAETPKKTRKVSGKAEAAPPAEDASADNAQLQAGETASEPAADSNTATEAPAISESAEEQGKE